MILSEIAACAVFLVSQRPFAVALASSQTPFAMAQPRSRWQSELQPISLSASQGMGSILAVVTLENGAGKACPGRLRATVTPALATPLETDRTMNFFET